MDDWEMLTETERLLLMAAAVHGLSPDADVTRANTARVVDQALRWRGLSVEEVRRGWEEPEKHPVNEEVYNVLIRMTHQMHRVGTGRPPERPGEPLFEGSGNWGVSGDPNSLACQPQFNSCRLTARGHQLAWELLKQYPEYRNEA